MVFLLPRYRSVDPTPAPRHADTFALTRAPNASRSIYNLIDDCSISRTSIATATPDSIKLEDCEQLKGDSMSTMVNLAKKSEVDQSEYQRISAKF